MSVLNIALPIFEIGIAVWSIPALIVELVADGIDLEGIVLALVGILLYVGVGSIALSMGCAILAAVYNRLTETFGGIRVAVEG